jgi:hypothetical protein
LPSADDQRNDSADRGHVPRRHTDSNDRANSCDCTKYFHLRPSYLHQAMAYVTIRSGMPMTGQVNDNTAPSTITILNIMIMLAPVLAQDKIPLDHAWFSCVWTVTLGSYKAYRISGNIKQLESEPLFHPFQCEHIVN